MIIYSIINFDKSTPFPSLYTLIPTIGTALLILCAVPNTFVHKIFTIKILVKIGLISYSAYLWHQPLLAFARHRTLGEVPDLMLLSLCITSLVMAWFSWQFIEKPFRDKKNIIKSSKIFVFSIFGIFLFSFIGFSMHYKQGFKERLFFSDTLSSSFQRPSFENCYDRLFSHLEEEWGCNLGIDEGDIDLILFGDSHSLSLKNLIHEKAKERGFKVFYVGVSGCLPFLGIYPQRNDQYENNCNLLNERVYKFAKENKVKGIILVSRWSYYTLGDYDFSGAQFISDKKDGPFSLEHSIETFAKSFDNTVKKYNSIKVPIHLITQPPHQRYEPESVYFWVTKGIGSIESYSVKRSDFQKLNKIPNDIFSNYDNKINLYNITDLFCDDLLCLLGTKSESFYYDQDHLSSFGASKLEETIGNIFSNK